VAAFAVVLADAVQYAGLVAHTSAVCVFRTCHCLRNVDLALEEDDGAHYSDCVERIRHASFEE